MRIGEHHRIYYICFDLSDVYVILFFFLQGRALTVNIAIKSLLPHDISAIGRSEQSYVRVTKMPRQIVLFMLQGSTE